MMHAVENKLEFASRIRDNMIYSEEGWMALNPEGFSYPDSYDNLPYEIYTDGYDRWFIDLYSKTYAKEDRARIMEYAVTGAVWQFAGYPERQAKLSYLCDAIRESFDTSLWSSIPAWEASLEASRN